MLILWTAILLAGYIATPLAVFRLFGEEWL